MFHIFFHLIVGVLIHGQRKAVVPVTVPRAGVDELNSEVNHLKEILANRSKMRQQTPAERDANPTTFEYARFSLTDEECKGIECRIKFMEDLIRRAKKKNKLGHDRPLHCTQESFDKFNASLPDFKIVGLRKREKTNR